MENQIEILTFKKNNYTDIKVSLVEEHGHTYVDIRQWKKTMDYVFPTKQGIRFDVAYLSGLQEAVEAIVRYLEGSTAET